MLAYVVATNASPQVASADARPYHLFSCSLVLMARAIEATLLDFTDHKDFAGHVTRKAEAANGIQTAVSLIHVAAGVPREVKAREVDGFVTRKASASLRGRIKRGKHRLERKAQRIEAPVR